MNQRELPEHPDFLWANPEPKSSYDVVIVGAGGHGLATAYYLAKNHGITNVAVLERGWLAGGNMARNTTIIRSNYLWDESAAIYEHALKLWEGLAGRARLRRLLLPARRAQPRPHPPGRARLRAARRGQPAQRRRRRVGRPAAGQGAVPDHQHRRRHPLPGHGRHLPAAGRHRQARLGRVGATPAGRASWGSTSSRTARSPASVIDGGRVTGVQTTRGRIAAGKVALGAAGHTSVLAELAGFRVPIQSHPLQALVSELHEIIHPTVVMSNHVHVYVSQAHKGELVMGAGIDAYNGYGQRGSFHVIEEQMAAAVELFPAFSPGAPAAHLGRHRRRDPGRLTRHGPVAGRRACTSTAAGAPADSRPCRVPAVPTRTPSPPTSPTS